MKDGLLACAYLSVLDADQESSIASMMVHIEKATKKHVPEVGRLFDLYRQFYECDADLERAISFIAERVVIGDSTIFVAMDDAKALGFVQLYPSYCSVELMKIQILYDLYVDATARQGKVGEQLMNHSSEFARDSGALRVDLSTENSNKIGQLLYEKLGYHIVFLEFYAYSLYL
jgi:ribosomal protein S18 acetylase RimI-like enzyme